MSEIEDAARQLWQRALIDHGLECSIFQEGKDCDCGFNALATALERLEADKEGPTS